jgi:hypothetical protein
VIAALFVESNGTYFGLSEVMPYDVTKDAFIYAGTYPVVAHPPCSVWCQLAPINQKRWGHKIGEDGGAFAFALASVRAWGGVLEHPARSYAWKAFSLPAPKRGSWQAGAGGWVTEVSQRAYGHRARKLTWLYAVSTSRPMDLNWDVPEALALISYCKNRTKSQLPRLGKKEASRTPESFRDALITIAEAA